MFTNTIIAILSTAAGLTFAAPSTLEQRGPSECTASPSGAYYACANNGFRGTCKSDPCAISWCPDYKFKTCELASSSPGGWTPPPQPPQVLPTCWAGAGSWYVCASNGFRGNCRSDPCNAGWCSDYKPKTCEPATPPPQPPTPTPVTPPPATGGAFYVCANNGFRGTCSVDPCAIPWCPDYLPGTNTVDPHAGHRRRNPEPVPEPAWSDPTVCAPGTGFFQACGNGFRGCCKTDACGPAGWCPQFKFGTYEPVGAGSPAPQPTSVTRTWTTSTRPASTPTPVRPNPGPVDPTVCAAGKGYFQVCANGFRGCCKADACTLGYCPN